MNKRKTYTFENTFPIHFQSSSVPKNMDNSFVEHSSQHIQLLDLNDNSENEIQHLDSESNESNTIQYWLQYEIKILLSYLSENFDLYRTNKTKFCAKVAIKIGNNRTGIQVKSKIQLLIEREDLFGYI